MSSRLAALCSALLLLSLSAPAVAQDAEAEAEASRFSGIVQFDFTNAYFFRGILQEREGFIWQPWAELYYSLYSSEDGPIRDISIGGGIWNSFHSERTLEDNTPQWLYETDLYPLVSVEFAGGVSLTTIYYWYTSPNGAFKTAQELNFKLAWDDSETFGKFAVQPWVNLAIETENTAFGPDQGVGLQLGIAPTLYQSENEKYPISITLPAEIGLSLGDYYEVQRTGPAPALTPKGDAENAFGYAALGLVASLPITAVPESFGAWSVNAGVKYYALSETLENANRGRSTYPVGTLSLAVEF